MQWLILTTNRLPEAHVMMDFLLERSEEVVLFNIRGRPAGQHLQVLKRLARKRGLVYLADLMLGRKFRSRYLDPAVRIFPEVTDRTVADIESRCTCIDIEDPHAEETLRRVKAIEPDYILLLGAPVIKPALFTLAQRGTLNWHHGLSPRYRGSDCVLWAMANNEFDQIGFTIHFVSEVVDGGRIILQRPVTVRKDLNFSEAVADVARQGLNGFKEVVAEILSGKPMRSKSQDKGGTHYPPIGLRGLRRAAGNFRTYAGQ